MATQGSSDISTYDVVPLQTAITSIKKISRLPCHLLQSQFKNPDFLGREDVLVKLDEALLPNPTKLVGELSTPNTFAIYDVGGVGETQIVVEFAYTRSGSFDPIF